MNGSEPMARKLLFIDRDGTLIEECADHQADRLDKLRLKTGVIPALKRLHDAGYALVMVSNQDGLGSAAWPQAEFDAVQGFVLDLFASQGIEFEAVRVCPHREADGCACRKPRTGLVLDYLRDGFDRERSAVIGDRDTDLGFARALGARGFKLAGFEGEGTCWDAVARDLIDAPRRGSVRRETRETRIAAEVDLDHEGAVRISTGLGFFDHMLEALCRHGGFGLTLDCDGDLHVDEHHTVEDCALALGTALDRALGERRGIARFGFTLPMDDARASATVDLGGRAWFEFDGRFPREAVGELPTELIPHFFRSLADSLRMNLHLSVTGENAHHMAEACFKATGRAWRQAFRREATNQLPSAKGVL